MPRKWNKVAVGELLNSVPRVRQHLDGDDRVYTDDEWEFIRAMQRYKERTGRRFPTWSEALKVLKEELGYRKHGGSDEPKEHRQAPPAVETVPGLPNCLGETARSDAASSAPA